MSTGERIADDRVAAARQALAERGVHGATVEVEGHEREIAAVRVPAGEWERVMGPGGASIADAVKAAGFRYVALDLAPEDDPPPDATSDADEADEASIADGSINVVMGYVFGATFIADRLAGLTSATGPLLLGSYMAARLLICLAAGYLGTRTTGNRALVAGTFMGAMMATAWNLARYFGMEETPLGGKEMGILLIVSGVVAIWGSLAGAAIARSRDGAHPQHAA